MDAGRGRARTVGEQGEVIVVAVKALAPRASQPVRVRDHPRHLLRCGDRVKVVLVVHGGIVLNIIVVLVAPTATATDGGDLGGTAASTIVVVAGITAISLIVIFGVITSAVVDIATIATITFVTAAAATSPATAYSAATLVIIGPPVGAIVVTILLVVTVDPEVRALVLAQTMTTESQDRLH